MKLINRKLSHYFEMASENISTLEENIQSINGHISSLYRCQTSEATVLCIYDAFVKLKEDSEYGIGGTYSGTTPEFWFFYRTSPCYKHNFLLNLFVCHRQKGTFSVQISNSSECTPKVVKHDPATHLILPRTYDQYNYKSAKPDQIHYIKTFCFEILEEQPNCVLLIPIKITCDFKCFVNPLILKSIKIQHDLPSLLLKQEKTDFILKSSSNREYPTHKILLAAINPVFRSMIKQTKVTSLALDISDNDMELILEYIYTAKIKNLIHQDISKILALAEQFQLKPLFTLTQYVLRDHILVDNAIELAVLAKKYELIELQKKVFNFIISNPKVMATKAWKELKDVEITKYLLSMHMMRE